MINEPISLVHENFQEAWLTVVKKLMISNWELHNIVVQVRNPSRFDTHFHEALENFIESEGLLGPKHVAYTIFPHKLYHRKGDAEALFDAYNRCEGLFEKLQRRKHGWGSYFRRMTCYENANGMVNQLNNIINAIRCRNRVSKAAYTIVIQKPGNETVRPRGGPCLNYIALQIEFGLQISVGGLAVYRNHDFLERAYGNYWGLCNLLMFLASEVNGVSGPLTCISSHAYVERKRRKLKAFVEAYNEISYHAL